MNVVRTLKHKPIRPVKLAGIDASSTGIAVCVIEQNDEVYVTAIYKLDLSGRPMQEKLRIISAFFALFLKNHPDLDHIFIEQPIYIQNPATSRVLSQVSGHIWGECLRGCNVVTEVVISNWKAFIGYKNVSKKEKDEWIREIGEKEAKKKAIRERKERTIRIIHEKVPSLSHIKDNDVCDAIGIALWGLDQENKNG